MAPGRTRGALGTTEGPRGGGPLGGAAPGDFIDKLASCNAGGSLAGGGRGITGPAPEGGAACGDEIPIADGRGGGFDNGTLGLGGGGRPGGALGAVATSNSHDHSNYNTSTCKNLLRVIAVDGGSPRGNLGAPNIIISHYSSSITAKG